MTPRATGDYDGLMNVWYQTNRTGGDSDGSDANATLSDGHDNPWLDDESTVASLGEDRRALSFFGWKLWREGVSTDEAVELDVGELTLAPDETITAVRFEYGRVDEGFTTRKEGWDRELLKYTHDDVASADTEEGGDLSPALFRLQVTDAYRVGTVLSNTVQLDLYRNGGGNHLEDHDSDYVEQVPAAMMRDLAQTGVTGTSTFILGVIVAGMGTMAATATHMRRRMAPRKRGNKESSERW